MKSRELFFFRKDYFIKLKIFVYIYEVLIFIGIGDEFSDCELIYWDYIK